MSRSKPARKESGVHRGGFLHRRSAAVGMTKAWLHRPRSAGRDYSVSLAFSMTQNWRRAAGFLFLAVAGEVDEVELAVLNEEAGAGAEVASASGIGFLVGLVEQFAQFTMGGSSRGACTASAGVV